MQKKIAIRLLIISCYFAAAAPLHAAGLLEGSNNRQNEFLLQSWQVEDGLPRHSVRSLFQTHDGYLWVGTYHGLGRFDGTRFTVFNTANTANLRSDAVATIYQDHGGILWIGTTGGGLVRYENGWFETVKLASDDYSELVEQICEDSDGVLWVVSSHAVFKGREGGFSLQPLAPDVILPRTYLMAIAPAADGTVWLGTSVGLHWLRDGKVGALGSLTNRSVWTMAFGKDGALWCGGAGEPGLQRIESGRAYHHPAFISNTVDCVQAARDGSIWVGTREGTLWRLDGERAVLCFAAPGGNSQRIQTIADDQDGNIWFGARASGLGRLSPKRVVTRSKANGLPSDEVTCLCEDSKGQMLLGTFGNGVHRLSSNPPRPLDPKLALGEIATMVSMRDGSVLIGGFHGTIWRWRDERLSIEGHAPDLQVLLEDRAKNIWIGTRMSGVLCDERGMRKSFSTAGLSHNRVYCMAEDASGAIWVGTEHGVNRIRNGRVEAFGRRDGLPAELFQAIWTEPDGTVWIGSTGGGLVRWRDGHFATLTTRQGLINDSIEQILGDGEGNLWIGTQLGLMRVSLADLNDCADRKLRFLHGRVFNRDDGLLVPNCGTEYSPSCLKARDGRLWFGMRSGLLIIDPHRLNSHTNPPPVFIENVLADGKPLPGKSSSRGKLVVPPATHTLEFQFTALDLSAPRKVRFRRRLVGYDQEWTEAGSERAAIYTKVPRGGYVFRVSACNSDGIWNDVGASLALTVAPQWWETWWAQWSVLLTLLALYLFYDRRRIQRLDRRRAEQEIFARRLIDSQETERRRIASELHDSLGQTLLIIKNRAFMGLKPAASPVAMREQLNEISDASAHSIEEVRSIARGLRPYQLDRLGLTKTLADVAELVTHSGGPQVTAHVDPVDRIFPPEVEISLYRIVQEGLNNAVKHAAANSVELTVQRQPLVVRIQLSDDGRGFDPTEEGFGLVGIKERVKLLGGTLRIDSAPGRGTNLMVEIPLPPLRGAKLASLQPGSLE